MGGSSSAVSAPVTARRQASSASGSGGVERPAGVLAPAVVLLVLGEGGLCFPLRLGARVAWSAAPASGCWSVVPSLPGCMPYRPPLGATPMSVTSCQPGVAGPGLLVRFASCPCPNSGLGNTLPSQDQSPSEATAERGVQGPGRTKVDRGPRSVTVTGNCNGLTAWRT